MATYIQTPKGLYPIGGQVTKSKIIKALGYTPSNFDGDYNSLNNKPDIIEDGSDSFYIADTKGNIIFKVDSNGIHSVNLTLNGKTINQVIQENTPSGDYNDLENKPEIIEDGSAELSIVDSQGNIVAKITSEGIQAVNFLVGEAKDKVALAKDIPAEISLEEINNQVEAITSTANEAKTTAESAQQIANTANSSIESLTTEVTKAQNKAEEAKTSANNKAPKEHSHTYEELENKPNISVDNSGTMHMSDDANKLQITDNTGNILMEVDATGLNVTNIKVNGIPLTDLIASEVTKQLTSN